MRTMAISIMFLAILLPCAAHSATPSCGKCHGKLIKNKVVHPALTMGCDACHTGIDASKVPHKITGKIAHGLSADQPDLCYGCHDSAQFEMKDVHPAIAMGCTTCHNPHSSPRARLLAEKVPELCFTCHDKAGFTNKRSSHPPVAQGKCLVCHAPHSSDDFALLRKSPVDVCLGCHLNIAHGKHVQGRDPDDPTRPGRPLYCGSCHDPHGSNGMLMFRFDAQTQTELCKHCHQF